MTVEAAWEKIAQATISRDIDDVKEAVQIYVKASPETTYAQLEEAFRKQNLKLYLIALEKPNIAAALTNMDLQGNLGKKYTVNYRFNPKPARPRESEGWPTPEENMERLADAGEVVDRGLPKCSNCSEIGHISKNCPQEKQERSDRATVKCYNCDQEGHRVRDCKIIHRYCEVSINTADESRPGSACRQVRLPQLRVRCDIFFSFSGTMANISTARVDMAPKSVRIARDYLSFAVDSSL